MESKITKTRQYRLDMNEKILNSGFKDFQKFFALDNKAYLDGSVPVKYKEMMGLVGSPDFPLIIKKGSRGAATTASFIISTAA
jgi:hypothetical protein